MTVEVNGIFAANVQKKRERERKELRGDVRASECAKVSRARRFLKMHETASVWGWIKFARECMRIDVGVIEILTFVNEVDGVRL